MECSDVHDKISAYLEDILSPEEKMILEDHFKCCQRCSQSLFDLKKTIEYVRNLEEIEPPLWLTQKVMMRVKEEAEVEKGFFRKLFYPLHIKLPIEIFAAIAVAITTIYIFKSIQPEIALETRTRIAKAPLEAVPESKSPSSVISKEPERSEEAPKQSPSAESDVLSQEKKVLKDKETPSSPSLTPLHPPLSRGELKGGKEEQTIPAKKPETVGEAGKVPAAPAPARKHDETMQNAGTLAKDESKRDASKLKASMVGRLTEAISLTINVKDLESASKETEKHVKELGGKVTKTEYSENKNILIAEISPDKLKGLFDKLKLVGEVKEKEVDLKTAEGNLEIRIEITRIQNDR